MDSSQQRPSTPPKSKRPWILWGGLISALVGYAVLIGFYMGAYAGGSDSSGYLNSAKLLREGRFQVQERTIAGVPPSALSSTAYQPLGFSTTDHNSMVPTYPVGFPLMIAGLSILTGAEAAPPVVIWLHALLGVVLMYAFARHIGLSVIASALGALLLAISPLYLLQSLQAMSDTPALVWCTAAVYFAWRSRERDHWAVAAGMAVAMSVLVRPTNVLVFAPVATCLGLRGRRWLWLALGGAPGAVFLGFYNYDLYGKIITTGYGDMSQFFGARFLSLSLKNYVLSLPIVLTPAVALLFALPWIAWRGPRLLAGVLAAWIAAYAGFYTFYSYTHETWWYLRFILPAFPAIILTMLLAGRALASTWPLQIRLAAAGLAALAILGWDGYWTNRNSVLKINRQERSYPIVTRWAQAHLPPNAILAVMQGSGTFFYYTDFTLLRYDVYNEEGRPGSFSALWQATQAGGRPIFAVLFPFELKNALENCLPGRWTQVGAIRDWTIWQLNGPEPAPVSAVPWHEIVYANFGAVDVSGRVGAGWFEIEHNQSNSWIWSQGRSTLEFESLPATNSTLQLKFGTRTLANCHVTINQDGAVLWQGAVGLERSEVQFNFHLKDGHARLDFTSDSPPVPESPRPDARLLSFAVYNAQLSLAHEAP